MSTCTSPPARCQKTGRQPVSQCLLRSLRFSPTNRFAPMCAGISTVIIPKLKEKDLVDVPEEAKQKLKFVPVENVDEVLAAALEKNGATKQQAGGSSSPKTMV